MRGSIFHNHFLVRPLADAALEMGAEVQLECLVGPGARQPTVDLCIDYGSVRIAVEVERSLARLEADIKKATALKANLLALVFPSPRLAAGAVRILRALPDTACPVRVFTLGAALAWLRRPDTWKSPESQKIKPNVP